MAVLLGVFALQQPEVGAVEEGLRLTGESFLEIDGSEPSADDYPTGLSTSPVDTNIDGTPDPVCAVAGFSSARRHPALNALNPRAPPA